MHIDLQLYTVVHFYVVAHALHYVVTIHYVQHIYTYIYPNEISALQRTT